MHNNLVFNNLIYYFKFIYIFIYSKYLLIKQIKYRSILALCNAVAAVNCMFLHSEKLRIVISIGNISKLLNSIALVIIRF